MLSAMLVVGLVGITLGVLAIGVLYFMLGIGMPPAGEPRHGRQAPYDD